MALGIVAAVEACRMGKHDTTELRNILQQAFRELKSLVLTTPPGVLGPTSLVAYEITSLQQRLAEVANSCNPVEVEGCLADAKRLLHRYKITSAAPS